MTTVSIETGDHAGHCGRRGGCGGGAARGFGRIFALVQSGHGGTLSLCETGPGAGSQTNPTGGAITPLASVTGHGMHKNHNRIAGTDKCAR